MYWVGADGALVPVGEEGKGEEMGMLGAGGDYVARARYVVGGPPELPAGQMGAVEYGRRVAKLERAVNDLRAGLAGEFGVFAAEAINLTGLGR
jgi:hypothetical protein